MDYVVYDSRKPDNVLFTGIHDEAMNYIRKNVTDSDFIYIRLELEEDISE